VFATESIRAYFLATTAQLVRAADDGQSWLDRIREALRAQLGPPLKSLHVPIDEWLGQLPMSVAVACAVGLYVLALLWVWVLRRDFVFRGAPDRHWWRDLRIWATVVVLPYIAIYLFFGR
jgi:hypothetical protein